MFCCYASKSNVVAPQPLPPPRLNDATDAGVSIAATATFAHGKKATSNKVAPDPSLLNATTSTSSTQPERAVVATNNATTEAAISSVQHAITATTTVIHSSGTEFREAVISSDMTLIQACKKGSLEDVKRLLTDDNVNTLGMWSSTPLIISLQYNYLDIATLLLSNTKIDVHHVNEKAATAMLFACMHGYADIVKVLLERKAVIDTPAAQGIYNEKFDKAMIMNPLSISCINGHESVASLLIDSGHCAVDHQFPFVAWKYGKGEGNATSSKESGSKMTPLALACAAGSISVICELLRRKADPYATDVDGCSPLHHALRSNSSLTQEDLCLDILNAFKSSVEHVSDGGVDNNEHFGSLFGRLDADGNSLLHLASENKQVKVCQFLLHEGCPVNIRTCQSGLTPLHSAMKRRCLPLAELLISHGADATITDSKNVSCLDLSLKAKETDPIAILVKNSTTTTKKKKTEELKEEDAAVGNINTSNNNSNNESNKEKSDAVDIRAADAVVPDNFSARLLNNYNYNETPIVKGKAGLGLGDGSNGNSSSSSNLATLTSLTPQPPAQPNANPNPAAKFRTNKALQASDPRESFTTPMKANFDASNSSSNNSDSSNNINSISQQNGETSINKITSIQSKSNLANKSVKNK